MGEVTINDLLDTNFKNIQFLKSKTLNNKYMMVFICNDLNSSIHLMQLFINNPYYFKIYTVKNNEYKFVLGFYNGEKELSVGIQSETLLSQFKNNEIDNFTTGAFEVGVLHLNETILPVQDYPFLATETQN